MRPAIRRISSFKFGARTARLRRDDQRQFITLTSVSTCPHALRARFGTNARNRRELSTMIRSSVASLFGATPTGWPRVQAICDFVHNHITFGYGLSSPTKTAFQAYSDRQGVCRDFAHLAVTFCRCMNIPARYCTGYLGDIGVPPPYAPMDFAAWFEAFLDDGWYTFDPRNNAPRIGRILIARGRDAADVALTTSFGPSKLQSFKVWTDEIAA